MKKHIICLCILATGCFGEGTLSETNSTTRSIKKTELAWTTSTNSWASGNVTLDGSIERITIKSTSGSTAPINLYDVTLKDEYGMDVLIGLGANAQSNVTQTFYASTNGLPIAVDGLHTLVVTNAGSQKSGSVILYTR